MKIKCRKVRNWEGWGVVCCCFYKGGMGGDGCGNGRSYMKGVQLMHVHGSEKGIHVRKVAASYVIIMHY